MSIEFFSLAPTAFQELKSGEVYPKKVKRINMDKLLPTQVVWRHYIY